MPRHRMPKPKQPSRKRGPKRKMPPGFEESDLVSMGISLPRAMYQLLTVVALKRRKAPEFKGRATVSAILTELVGRHVAELKAEAGEHLKLAELL